MGIVLSPELEALIKDKVASGAYDSPDQVVEQALKLLSRRDEALIERNQKLQWLRDAWAQGMASRDLGPLTRDELMALARGEKTKDPVGAK